MLSRLGIENAQVVTYVVAFVIILALVSLFGVVLRRLSSGRLMLPGQDRGRSRQPRLGVVDIYDLDRQRQLILLRRDNVEHLLLIGGPNDVVIETNIVRVPPARTPAPSSDADRQDPSLEPAAPSRPIVELPVRPALEPAAARLGPVGIVRPAGPSDAAQELSPVASIPPVPTPARTEPLLKPDSVTLAPAPERDSPVAPARPAPPARAERPPLPPRPRPPEPPAPPPPARESRVPDAAILNDMTRQLEEALRRPVPPAPSAAPMHPAPVAPGPRHDAPPPGPPPRLTVAPEPPRAASAAPPPRPNAPPNEPPRPAAEPPPGPTPPVQARSAPDPFSVDDIEAEFARLLGRPADKS